MPGSFFDSNVLLYLASDDTAKAARAEALLDSGGTISVQVLNEIANVARRKMRFTWREMHTLLASIRALLAVEPLTLATHEDGLWIAERYELSIFDATIAASALAADCDVLLSEDMHDGLLLENKLRIVNPFKS